MTAEGPGAEDGTGHPAGLRFPLRFRILVVIAVVLLVAVGLYAAFATHLVTEHKLAEAYQTNATGARELAQQLRLYLRLLERELSLPASAALARHDRGEDAAPALDQARDDVPEVIALQVVVGGEGGPHTLTGRTWSERLLYSERDPDEVLRALGRTRAPIEAAAALGVAVENVSVPPDVPLLRVTLPLDVEDAHGRPAFASAVVRADAVLEMVTRDTPYAAYFVDVAGRALVHPDSAVATTRQDLSSRAAVQAAITSPFAEGVRELASAHDEPLIGGFARVGDTGLRVVTEMPKASALLASAALVRRSLLFAGASLSLALLASVLLSRRLTRSLSRLHAASRAVAGGQLDVELDVASSDEIGDLAQAFRAMTRALKDAQEQLVRSERLAAFGQLGAGIAHEVKNPLTSIIGFTQLARRRVGPPEKLDEYLEKVERESRRCKEIIDNLLRFARASHTELEPVDVNEQVEDGLKLVRHQLSVHRVLLVVELAGELPRVLACAGHLHQVLLNVVLNAQQAMPRGGTVTVRTRAEGDRVVIEVQDTGPGVPPDVRGRIFEPFFTTKGDSGGSGLGLSVCFGIIKDHGGAIAVDDAPEGGAIFRITLPAMSEAALTQGGAR